ncbi:MAG TPA: phage holin family protein [Acidimicrobiales bacterium]|nr:phage holin family protein [Acidimicrobiales bacterium]
MQHPRVEQTLSDESVGELVKRAASQTAELVRKEIQLGQLEIKDKGRRAGKGVGLLGGAGLVAFYGGAALIAAAVLGLAEAVDPWLSALIVGLILLVIAAVVGLVGKKTTTAALPPKPEQTMASVHDDIEHVKEQTSR